MRAGRMTPAQERGWRQGMPRFGLNLKDGLLDWDAQFGFAGKRVIEIGFGMGDSLLEMALADSATQFIGIEVHRPGVGRLLGQLLNSDCRNLCVYAEDAVEVLEHCMHPGSIDAVHIFFPDPWHKKRHHKRRLIQPDFVRLVTRLLRPGGYLHLATDWEPYAEHMVEVLDAAPEMRSVGGTLTDPLPRPTYRPLTKFEARGERLGHGVWDWIYYRS
ncbi:MAG: tRNA (guanosine(46)-N7)-methyltransferase TrmB [Halieaceae bacterium]|jgi:tRNA (guanine-N7-)-methyltransferase